MHDEDEEYEDFAVTLTDQAKTHGEWLSIVKFGLPTLMQDQKLLMEIIVRRAQVVCDQNKKHVPHRVVADDAWVIMDELGLKFDLAN
jgi:hypothetical protein